MRDRPKCDNPSGEFCRECRAIGVSHCGYPDECGGMRPVQHHDACQHAPTPSPARLSTEGTGL